MNSIALREPPDGATALSLVADAYSGRSFAKKPVEKGRVNPTRAHLWRTLVLLKLDKQPAPMTDSANSDPDTLAPSDDPAAGQPTVEPPRTFGKTLRQLGPGLIIAGSIVGSGELIATTKTGAQAGISLLWLVIIGCVIKVFVPVLVGTFGFHQQTQWN